MTVGGRVDLARYAGLEGTALLARVLGDFPGRSAVVSSFGAESAVLLHMVATVDRATPVIFLDTGKHFTETLLHRDALVARLGLADVRIVAPDVADLSTEDPDGRLHTRDADRCCDLRKTRPLRRALEAFDVVVSGRKRYHGGARATIDALSIADGRLKVDPLAAVSAREVSEYAKAHDLPSHPLSMAGYASVGCAPCTEPGGSAEDPRAGRWAGTAKTECGIHWIHEGGLLRPRPRGADAATASGSAGDRRHASDDGVPVT